MTVGSFFALAPRTLGPALRRALPDGVRVGFDLEGEGGGAWTVERRGPAVEVAAGLGEPLDCRMTSSVADFVALVEGGLDPRRAFLTGRIQVEGDVSLVLGLARVVRRAKVA